MSGAAVGSSNTTFSDPSSSSSLVSNDPPQPQPQSQSQLQPPEERPPPLHHRAVYTSNVTSCIARLKAGGLVALPTETVYGLAADAQNENALRAIFTAKERPLSDPLIVHVDNFNTAMTNFYDPTQLSDTERNILQILAHTFWPGPLTMVGPANPVTVLPIVTANTGKVAIRCPKLIPPLQPLLTQIAFCAPSANKFGHVSPTTAQHVMDDLQKEDVWIYCTNTNAEYTNAAGDDSATDADSTKTSCCAIGVESTIVQVHDDNVVTILRPGSITYAQLVQALPSTVTVRDKQQAPQQPPATHAAAAELTIMPHVAPGQLLQHYAPRLPSYMIAASASATATTNNAERDYSDVLSQSVVLDLLGQLAHWQHNCLAYRNLGHDEKEIAYQLFHALRWAENIPNAKYVFFPQLVLQQQPQSSLPSSSSSTTTNDNNNNNNNDNDQKQHTTVTVVVGTDSILAAVADRLHRAASGRVLTDLTDLLV
jgi:L-threonylcarbamoyladenylate synthase